MVDVAATVVPTAELFLEQGAQAGESLSVTLVAIGQWRRLQIGGELGKTRVAHQPCKWGKADQAVAYHLMSVDARAEWLLGVVEVKGLEVGEPHQLFEGIDGERV